MMDANNVNFMPLQFTIWMPETPLTVDVADARLSQIKGWKVASTEALASTSSSSSSSTDRRRRKATPTEASNKTLENETSSSTLAVGDCRYEMTGLSPQLSSHIFLI